MTVIQVLSFKNDLLEVFSLTTTMSEFEAPSSSSGASSIPVLSYTSISPRSTNNDKNSRAAYPPLLHICGCYGIRHRLAGSCVFCGRVVCDAEATATSSGLTILCGCPTCGNAVVPPMTADQIASLGADTATSGAYQQKDKLMTFDREHAKRYLQTIFPTLLLLCCS